jgi:hypothetical protein
LGWKGIQVWFWSSNQAIAYATHNGKIHLYDFASGQWMDRATPNQSGLMGIGLNANGSIGILTGTGGFGGVLSNVYLSQDNAATWKEITGPFNLKWTIPLQTANGDILVPCGAFGKTSLQCSKDGGQTWSSLGGHDIRCGLVALPSGKLFRLRATQLGVEIWNSPDNGATWKQEDTILYSAGDDPKPAR